MPRDFGGPTPEEMGLEAEKSGVKPEEKPESGQKVFDFLKRTGFLDVRKSDEAFEDWVQKNKYEDYMRYVTHLNGILRETPIKRRRVDGSNVEISFGVAGDEVSYLPPPEDQKNALMREAFDALKKLPDNNDRAALSYYSMQALHLYSDGNGRTGRLLYRLISEHGKIITKENLAELLDHEKKGHEGTGQGREQFAKEVLAPNSAYYFINRELARTLLGEDFLQEYGSIYYTAPLGVSRPMPEKLNLPEQDAKLAQKILGEGDVPELSFRSIVIAKLLRENGKLKDCQYELAVKSRKGQVIPDDVGKKVLGINDDKFIDTLTAEDVKRLIEIHRELKIQFMRTMIDIFVKPNDHQIKNREGQDIPVKAVFTQSI